LRTWYGLGVPYERRWPDFLADDFVGARRASGRVDWFSSAVIAGGLVLGSSALDKRAFTFADKRKDRKWLREGVRLGNALPVAAMGLSGVFAFDDSRSTLSDAGVAALEAGAAAFLATEGFKYAVGRARPDTGLGHKEFQPGSSEDRFHSFPSRHVSVMWAAVTPYAKEFGASWLYGAAALTNAARVGSREHWFSDTVGGAVLGYALGTIAWEARRDSRLGRNGPRLAIGPNEVSARWEFQ
jgi:membrane-associated phospholipid phosphatase